MPHSANTSHVSSHQTHPDHFHFLFPLLQPPHALFSNVPTLPSFWLTRHWHLNFNDVDIWKWVSSFPYSYHIFTGCTACPRLLFLAPCSIWPPHFSTCVFHEIYRYQSGSLVFSNITLNSSQRSVSLSGVTNDQKSLYPCISPTIILTAPPPILPQILPPTHHPLTHLTNLHLINPSWDRCWQHLRQSQRGIIWQKLTQTQL